MSFVHTERKVAAVAKIMMFAYLTVIMYMFMMASSCSLPNESGLRISTYGGAALVYLLRLDDGSIRTVRALKEDPP